MHSISRGNCEIAVQLQPDMHVFHHGWLAAFCLPLDAEEGGWETGREQFQVSSK